MKDVKVNLRPELLAQGFRAESISFMDLWKIAAACGIQVKQVVAALEGRSDRSALPVSIQFAKLVQAKAAA